VDLRPRALPSYPARISKFPSTKVSDLLGRIPTFGWLLMRFPDASSIHNHRPFVLHLFRDPARDLWICIPGPSQLLPQGSMLLRLRRSTTFWANERLSTLLACPYHPSSQSYPIYSTSPPIPRSGFEDLRPQNLTSSSREVLYGLDVEGQGPSGAIAA